MKLLIYTAVWKRPEITEICFMGIKRLQKVSGFDIGAFAVISEPEMIPLCEKYGVEWCMHKNHPLGEKKNYGIKQALRKDFEYLIEIGSDDLLKDEILQAYKWDAPVLGLMDFALIDVNKGYCKRVASNIPKFGAGRAIQRFVLESMKLWDDKKINGLDNNSSRNLAVNGFMQRGVRCAEPVAVALKSEVSLWSYRSMPGAKYPIEKALEGLSVEEVTAIKSLQYATA